ncbi:MAG: NAD(P)/FAD-dependent oxidoreductase [Thermoclostridium sp.]|nr:NAD(P)/FAD-dependent oxidoreductase [Thermoclostridium sp.]
MTGKKIVIVGAGYGGIKAALVLNRRKKKENLEITIIDRHDYHTLLTELHEVAGNRVSEDAVKIPLKDIFRYTGVKVVTDEIKTFDFKNNKVISENHEYPYDYLVVGTGSKPNFYGVPAQSAYTLWSFEDAIKIREHIKDCFEKAVGQKNEAELSKLLTFVVAGAGFTGVEMIGELAHWTRDMAREHGIDRKKVRLILVDLLPRVLNTLNEKISVKAQRYMEKKLGIELMLKTTIKEITPDGFSTGESFIPSKTVIWAAGITAGDSAGNMPVEKTARSKRVCVDEYCRAEYKNVYAVGDICGLINKDGKEYPAMVETALYSAEGAAKNILNDIRQKEPEKVEFKLHGSMVCIGNFYGVSEIMGKSLPILISMLMKYLVNMHYLYEIVGFRGVGRYLYHEFYERKQRKILPEKHWSTRMQAWWLTPLRMFFGVMWLWEGIKKVTENWLTTPKLASFLGMSTDGISSASPSATYITRIDDIFSLDIKILHFFLGKESRLVEGNTISSDIFAKLEVLHIGDFNLVDWFLRNIVLANDAIAMIFQVLVVVLEIAVGLMLLGGAFSFIGSVISFGLMMMFITSTGLYEKSWWMIFASIATMGGAGRAFGLDYYLQPWLNNMWNNYKRNGRLKLFFKGGLHRNRE